MALFSEQERMAIFSSLRSSDRELAMLSKYLEVVKLETNAARRQLFSDATADEKRMIWKTKMAIELATEQLDDAQRNLIAGGIDTLSDQAIYSPEGKARSKELRDAFLKQALEHFSKQNVYRLFVSLSGDYGCLVETKAKSDGKSPTPNGPSAKSEAATEVISR